MCSTKFRQTDIVEPKIILATLNAKYIHASLGLRYLYSNLAELQSQAQLAEFTIKRPATEIADELLVDNPAIIGFGIYIWNTEQTAEVIRHIKKRQPETIIVIGGPEVSYEYHDQTLYGLCDHLITGQADQAFRALCQGLLEGRSDIPKVINPAMFKPNELALPYKYYNDDDIAHRVIYVEASRGCPFKCEFCLSSLDKTAWPFSLGRLLVELDKLYRRGARNFKFVDRTFNLKIASCVRILEFFLDRMDDSLFLHFELIPDNLPEALKQRVAQFPPGSLQFEIGVQTFTPQVQSLISRRQDNTRTKDNISWLKTNSRAHLHTDLIFGLPGETLESFAGSFNQLYALRPDEIQVGILKRLRGTPIIRHCQQYKLEFDQHAPYEIQSSRDIDRTTLQRMVRFARFWDLCANSGRFRHGLAVILDEDPFDQFLALSDYLYKIFARTHSIHLDKLFTAVEQYEFCNLVIRHAINKDRLAHQQPFGPAKSANSLSQRQQRHYLQ